MAEIHFSPGQVLVDARAFQLLRRRKLGAVVKGNAFEDCPKPPGTKFPFQCVQRLDHRFSLAVWYRYNDFFPGLALGQGQ